MFVLMSREQRKGGACLNIQGSDCFYPCWKDKRAKESPWKLGISTGGDETQSGRVASTIPTCRGSLTSN